MGNQCRGCGSSKLDDIFSLGSIPPVNLFVRSATETFAKYPLDVVFCNSCTLVQLKTATDPKLLFSNYQYLSSASQTNVDHLNEVSSVMEKLSHTNLPLLEIGTNDGSLLKEVRNWSKKKGINTISIDPAENLSESAKTNSDFHYCKFFDELSARAIRSEHGGFQLVVALNVIAHTPHLHSFLKGVSAVLDQDGVFLFECTDVIPTILAGQFDTVYHEHYSYFSEHAIHKILDQVNLSVFRIEKINTQGGSLRIFAKKSNHPSSERKNSRILHVDDFKKVSEMIEIFKTEFNKRLNEYRNAGKQIIGLGAPARGMVILHTLNLKNSNIEWIIDDTPHKQSRYIPGTGIKIENWDSLNKITDSNLAFVLLSWNYRDEIIEKLKKQGIKKATILVPFPKIEELSL